MAQIYYTETNYSNLTSQWTTTPTHSFNNTLYNMTTTMTPLTESDHAVQALKGIVMTAIILATVVGNLIVISAFIKFRSLKTMNNCFIVSLAVADLLVGK